MDVELFRCMTFSGCCFCICLIIKKLVSVTDQGKDTNKNKIRSCFASTINFKRSRKDYRHILSIYEILLICFIWHHQKSSFSCNTFLYEAREYPFYLLGHARYRVKSPRNSRFNFWNFDMYLFH